MGECRRQNRGRRDRGRVRLYGGNHREWQFYWNCFFFLIFGEMINVTSVSYDSEFRYDGGSLAISDDGSRIVVAAGQSIECSPCGKIKVFEMSP
mmetsp:Transcript_23254/g.37820  ORF Transcript_23254/g.37820 Transcript_23254/m.37820 type:complete len:94 (-) Transcript_23254:1427-1708(-)